MRKYYYKDQTNKKQGPFLLEDLIKKPIYCDTLIWYEDLTDWKKASEISDITILLGKLPPYHPSLFSEKTIKNEIGTKSNKENSEVNTYAKTVNNGKIKSLTDAKVIGGIGTILTFINLYPSSVSTGFSVIGYILQLIAFYKLSKVYSKPRIFNFLITSFIFNIVAIIAIFYFVISAITEMFSGNNLVSNNLLVVTSNIQGFLFLAFFLIAISVTFFISSLKTAYSATKNSSFNVAANLYIFIVIFLFFLYIAFATWIGRFESFPLAIFDYSNLIYVIILSVIIGILSFIATIFLTIGFFSINDRISLEQLIKETNFAKFDKNKDNIKSNENEDGNLSKRKKTYELVIVFVIIFILSVVLLFWIKPKFLYYWGLIKKEKNITNVTDNNSNVNLYTKNSINNTSAEKKEPILNLSNRVYKNIEDINELNCEIVPLIEGEFILVFIDDNTFIRYSSYTFCVLEKGKYSIIDGKVTLSFSTNVIDIENSGDGSYYIKEDYSDSFKITFNIKNCANFSYIKDADGSNNVFLYDKSTNAERFIKDNIIETDYCKKFKSEVEKFINN